MKSVVILISPATTNNLIRISCGSCLKTYNLKKLKASKKLPVRFKVFVIAGPVMYKVGIPYK